jgi:nicotinate-nucleotide adenylyltransferase
VIRWSEVSAVFGGRFDPPHLGHVEAVRGLFREPGVRRVFVVPSAQPPHKAAAATAAQRLEMARAAFAGLGGDVIVDDRELRRAGPSYSYDTLQELRRETPELAFVVGADQLRDLRTWHRFPEILGLAHWIVLARKPDGEALTGATLREWESAGLARPERGGWRLAGGRVLIAVPTAAPAVSSTAVREAIGRTGQAPEGTVSEGISAYLKQNRLYGTGALK